MREYKQLRYEERVKLAELRQSQSSLTQISEVLGRSKSTISRELRRNQAPPGQYWPDTAELLTQERRRRGCRIDHKESLKNLIVPHSSCKCNTV